MTEKPKTWRDKLLRPKKYPIPMYQPGPSNRDGNQNNIYFGERYGWVVALVIAIIAIVMGVLLWAEVRSARNEVENIRGLIENSADSASQAAANAAVAADRTDRAERRANVAEAYAKQVYVELNRLGYPVQTPIEEHSVAPVEAYKRDP